MKLVIERDRWFRGRAGSALVRLSDGKMCCLGFLGNACGGDPTRERNSAWTGESDPSALDVLGRPNGMRGVVMPLQMQDFWPKWLFLSSTGQNDHGGYTHSFYDVAGELAGINDSRVIPDTERERQIIEIMGKHGVEVEFV